MSALEALARSRDQIATSRRSKCFTCRVPAWADFVREGLEAGFTVNEIHAVLVDPKAHGMDFPPYYRRDGTPIPSETLQNHVSRKHHERR